MKVFKHLFFRRAPALNFAQKADQAHAAYRERRRLYALAIGRPYPEDAEPREYSMLVRS